MRLQRSIQRSQTLMTEEKQEFAKSNRWFLPGRAGRRCVRQVAGYSRYGARWQKGAVCICDSQIQFRNSARLVKMMSSYYHWLGRSDYPDQINNVLAFPHISVLLQAMSLPTRLQATMKYSRAIASWSPPDLNANISFLPRTFDSTHESRLCGLFLPYNVRSRLRRRRLCNMLFFCSIQFLTSSFCRIRISFFALLINSSV